MRRRIEGRERLFAVGWTAILLTACVCIVLAGLSMQKAQDLQRNISILFENEPISGAGAQAIRDAQHRTGDAADFVVWQEYKNRSVTNEQQTGAVFTNVLEFSGSPALLLPKGYLLGETGENGCLIGEKTAQELFGSRRAAGNRLCYKGEVYTALLLPKGYLLGETGENGCLIGEKTAQELFGSRRAAGNRLCYKGEVYTVRGVLKEPAELVVLENNSKEAVFGRMTIAAEAQRTKGRAAEQFLSGYGLDGRCLRYDFLEAAYWMELIPGKWSDFEQLDQSFLKLQKDMADLFAAEKSSLELLWFQSVGFSTFGCLAGIFLLWKLFFPKRVKT